MARAPTPPALSVPPPGAAGGMAGADPMAGGDPDSGGDDSGGGDNVVVTICSNDDGSYTVYAGSPPDADDGSDMSDDDTDAMGAAGAAPAPGGGAGGGAGGMAGGMAGGGAPQGQPADSIGAAFKAALDIMNADKSSEGAPGNADDQLNAGFSASQSPTPATGPPQKY
jgi:hypothetical protein